MKHPEFLTLGICLGVALGVVFHNIAMGVALGAAFGVALAAIPFGRSADKPEDESGEAG